MIVGFILEKAAYSSHLKNIFYYHLGKMQQTQTKWLQYYGKISWIKLKSNLVGTDNWPWQGFTELCSSGKTQVEVGSSS